MAALFMRTGSSRPARTPTAAPLPLASPTHPTPPAVLFGLLILLAPMVAAASYYMKWGLTATFLVACLWALNAVVMFLGMGAPVQLPKPLGLSMDWVCLGSCHVPGHG